MNTNSFSEFQSLNRGYNEVFQADQLSIGLVVPIEQYEQSPIPTMHRHIERVQLAEELGFSSVWIRDVPFNVPSFGDAGQTFDPFVYLGMLSAKTQKIALGVASIILPLRHPAHVAKAAATADVLSGGRLILGVASGDRPDEYPAHNIDFHERGKRFRDSFEYIRQMENHFPGFENPFGHPSGHLDMLPKPTAKKIPMLVTGRSQQSPVWLASYGDGRMLYPRPAETQSQVITKWRSQMQSSGRSNQPILEPLYIDLVEDANALPTRIHLGYRMGINELLKYLLERQQIGVNHIALNLRFNRADTETTMRRIAETLFPHFNNNPN